MANRPPLTPQSAEITTASVQIKAMTVNGKQVTLAVFRQLYEQPLFHSTTWKALGTPWCRVNYHPDKCANDPTHEHVVWQVGDELRRARVDRPTDSVDLVPRWDKGPQDELAVCIAAGAIGNVRITKVNGATTYTYSSKAPVEEPAAYITGKFASTGREAKAKLYLSSPEVANLVKGYGAHRHPGLESEHRKLHPDSSGCADTAKLIGQRLTWTDTWLERAWDRWEEIRDLPQVFIAL